MVHVEPLVTVTVYPFEIVTGPALIPFSVPANVIFSAIVLPLVLIIALVPKEGPPACPQLNTPDPLVFNASSLLPSLTGNVKV